jgi:LAS superfamily LD-carboxypeptidase LdcB
MASNGQLPPSSLAPIYRGQLRKDAAAGFNAMNVEARKLGVELYPTGSKSSYRTYAQQQELRALYLSGRGNLAAVPGTSNHGWGTAVDFATPAMRAMVDRIGTKYGWSKQWSDAQSEWWHILYQAGHYSGLDPGPEGVKAAPPPPPPPPSDHATGMRWIESGMTPEGKLP